MSVNPQAIAQASDQITSCGRALDAERDGLDQFLATLRSTWHGSGGLSWQQAQNNWHNACDEIHLVLNHLRNAVDAAHSNYHVTENGITNMWGG
jgi:WXG100 family type VII secretion target